MHFLNKLIPNFLKKLDRHLLLNHRLIWETKFHFVLFYGLLAFGGYTLLGLIYPISLKSSLPDPVSVGIIAGIPAFILLCYWIYTQAQYAIESDFGRLFSGLAQWRFLIYFSSILIFIAPATHLGFLINDRIANLVEGKELDEDVLSLNIGNPLLLVSDGAYYYDDFYVSDAEETNILEYLDCRFENKVDDYCANYDFEYFGRVYTDLYSFYGNADSQNFIYGLRTYFKFDSSLNKEQKLGQIKGFKKVFEKYGGRLYANSSEIYESFYKNEQIARDLAYQKAFVKGQINKIEEAKVGMTDYSFSASWKLSLIVAFMLSLVLYTLKNVTLKDFIISIVSLVGVGIATIALTALWAETVNYSVMDTEGFFAILSTGTILFTIAKISSINTSQVYSRFKTVCLVAFTFVGPFLLLWSAITLHIVGNYRFIDSDAIAWNVILFGCVIHLLFTMPWLRKKFLIMKSLPKA